MKINAIHRITCAGLLLLAPLTTAGDVLLRKVSDVAPLTPKVEKILARAHLENLSLLRLCTSRWFEVDAVRAGLSSIDYVRLNDHVAQVGLGLFLNAAEIKIWDARGRPPDPDAESFVERFGFSMLELISLRSLEIHRLRDLERFTVVGLSHATFTSLKPVVRRARALGLRVFENDLEAAAWRAGRLEPARSPLSATDLVPRLVARLNAQNIFNVPELVSAAAARRLPKSLGPKYLGDVEAFLCALKLDATG